MEIGTLAIGIIVGGIIGFLAARLLSKNSVGDDSAAAELQSALVENAKLEEAERRLSTERSELKASLTELQTRLEDSERNLTAARTHFKDQEERIRSQKEEFEALNERFNKEFQNLANKILEEKSKKFTDQNKEQLEGLLNPLKEKIKDFEEKVERSYGEEKKDKAELKGEIKQLMELNKKISEEANNLASALKGDSKKQGNWGEMILERILETSGLIKNQEYKTQDITYAETGERLYPDVVVYLPDEKHIIIDSKVSLVAYERFSSSEDEDERAKFLKLHVESVKTHIKGLSEKNYQVGVGINSPDFVLMFMPIESSFTLSIQADNELFNFAWERKIVIVSPSTLLATLRTVSSIWNHDRQSKNAQEIAKKSGQLYDKFVGFMEDMQKIGDRLESTQKVYNEGMKKLSDGSGNLVRRTEELKKMGAKATKSLPENLLEDQHEE